MRKIIVLALILVVTGCAWSRGRTRLYEDSAMVQDRHCWTIVAGKGKLGAHCTPEETDLASEGTDSIAELIGAATEGAARGALTP